MTAFDNIKTNNWPSASNEFEDFLVLKLPLNDNASLTESLPVVAGSKELFPKRTLTNSGVASLAAQTGAPYASMLTIDTSVRDNTPTSNAFDGSTTTQFKWNVSGTSVGNSGTATITFNPPIQNVTQLRVHAWLNDNQYDKHGVSINNGTYVYPNIYGGDNQWHDLFDSSFSSLGFSSGGTLSKLQFRTEVDMNGQNPPSWIRAIEVNGTILQDAPGGPKKHYDNNATFNGSSTLLLSNSGINLGGDYCVECYFRPSGSIGEHTRIFECQPANFAFYIYGSNNSTYVQVGGGSSLSGGANTWTINTWHHFATTRQNGVTRLFIDGVQKGSSGSSTAALNLGTTINLNGDASGNYRWSGAMQDFRIYNGVAKYTSNFTPPSAILG